jgi:hypothetical protein
MFDLAVYRPGARDEFGDRSGSPVLVGTLRNCKVAPAGLGSAEQREPSVVGADPVRHALDVFCSDPEADVEHSDRIVHRGETFRVVGEIDRWGRSGCVIHLAREAG